MLLFVRLNHYLPSFFKERNQVGGKFTPNRRGRKQFPMNKRKASRASLTRTSFQQKKKRVCCCFIFMTAEETLWQSPVSGA